MRLLKPDRAGIAAAAAALAAGRLVAFPTETVYGLGADAGSDHAVAAVYAAKDRPRFNPLIVHLPDTASAARVVRFDARARALAARFWPGPLTIVLPRAAGAQVSLLATAGLDTVAVRVPDHPVARSLLRSFGRPVVAPSANRSGRISPTEAAHVADELGDRVEIVLDGGPCRVGVESTVLDLSTGTPTLLRPGGITVEALEEALGPIAGPPAAGPLRSPGQLASHYAPALPVRLDADAPRPGEAWLGFGPAAGPRGEASLNLSSSGDLTEAAANLFRMLRILDRPDFTAIAVSPIPKVGLGLAINDRLARAAAPRGA